MSELVLACRKCGAPLDAGRAAALHGASATNVLLDLACGQCGRRALYDMGSGPLRAVLNKPAARV